jgi:hypothetical protein
VLVSEDRDAMIAARRASGLLRSLGRVDFLLETVAAERLTQVVVSIPFSNMADSPSTGYAHLVLLDLSSK